MSRVIDVVEGNVCLLCRVRVFKEQLKDKGENVELRFRITPLPYNQDRGLRAGGIS